MPAHTSIEIERKYDVDAETILPSLTAVDGVDSIEGEGAVELSARYFDTMPPSLLERRIVIRRREGGGDEGWHIKASTPEGRIEKHWPLGDADVMPPEAEAEIREVVGDAELTVLARIKTRRTAHILLDGRGMAVAEVADDRVVATDAAGTRRSWREWEVELLPAAPADAQAEGGLLDRVEAELLSAGAVPSRSVAKIARALGQG